MDSNVLINNVQPKSNTSGKEWQKTSALKVATECVLSITQLF